MCAARIGALVPLEAEPAKVAGDRILGVTGRSLNVRVLNPQNEDAGRIVVLPAMGEQPVEQRRPRVADVEVSGRAWSKSHSHDVDGSQGPWLSPVGRLRRA